MYIFVGRQACSEDVAFALATCSGQVQHARSLNLHMIMVKVEALQQDSVSEWLRRWTRNPLGSARRVSNPLAVVLFLLWVLQGTKGCAGDVALEKADVDVIDIWLLGLVV